MKGITVAEAARRRGVTRRAIERGVQRGKYVKLPDGSIDPASVEGPPERGPRAADGSYGRIRAAHEALKARLTQLELEVRSGQKVDLQETRMIWFRKVRSVRDRFLDLPARVAAPLAGMGDVAEIRAYLEREIRQVLEELTDDPPGA